MLELDILDDPAICEKYKEEIPVVFINGRKAFNCRVDGKRFIKLIGE